MRGGLRSTCVIAMAVAALAGCTWSAADQRSDPAPTSPSPTSPATPAVVKDCWVPTSAGNISLAGEQARALTTRAAELGGRTPGNPEGVAVRLATAVALADVEVAVAREVADGLAGRPRAPRLICSYPRGDVAPQQPGPSGLVPRARRLRAAWTEVFGPLIAAGFARGGVSSGHVDGSAHYEGRAIDIFFRPFGDAAQARRGWAFAQWLVAHAPDHQVLSVIWDDHIWTSWASYAGWRDYVHPGASPENRGNAVLRHRDHVHVAVESGQPYQDR